MHSSECIISRWKKLHSRAFSRRLVKKKVWSPKLISITFFTSGNFPSVENILLQEPRSQRRVLAKKWAKGLRERRARDHLRRWSNTKVPSSFRRGPLFYTCEHFAGTMVVGRSFRLELGDRVRSVLFRGGGSWNGARLSAKIRSREEKLWKLLERSSRNLSTRQADPTRNERIDHHSLTVSSFLRTCFLFSFSFAASSRGPNSTPQLLSSPLSHAHCSSLLIAFSRGHFPKLIGPSPH